MSTVGQAMLPPPQQALIGSPGKQGIVLLFRCHVARMLPPGSSSSSNSTGSSNSTVFSLCCSCTVAR